MAREDVIAMMQKDVSVSIVSNYGGSQDLQAFRIGYQRRGCPAGRAGGKRSGHSVHRREPESS